VGVLDKAVEIVPVQSISGPLADRIDMEWISVPT
jgi:hypothetical protein